jgi:hypothetical protein
MIQNISLEKADARKRIAFASRRGGTFDLYAKLGFPLAMARIS